MKQLDQTTILADAPPAGKDQVLQAVHDLVMNGYASLYPISDKDSWLRLETGEAFMMSQHGVLRIV
jgi:hypothetical protein